MNDEVMRAVRTRSEERRFRQLSEMVNRDPATAFKRGVELLRSAGFRRRRLGADLVGQAAGVDAALCDEANERLIARLEIESRSEVRAAIIAGIGRSGRLADLAVVLKHADDSDPTVRQAVAFAWSQPSLSSAGERVLRRLTTDEDEDVRDWATFALAESDSDSKATRRALLARTRDSSPDVRAEGMYGLAKRHDPRVGPMVAREMRGAQVGALVIEAARLLDLTPVPETPAHSSGGPSGSERSGS